MNRQMEKAKKRKEIDNIVNIKDIIEENEYLKKQLEIKNNYIKDLEELRDDLVKDAYRAIDLNSKLADSEEKLKSILAQKDKFFSIIAHDLRNPIGNFKELTSILTDNYNTFSEEEKKELIFELSKSSKHIYSLLENLLEWSRVQLGRIKLEPENIFIHQLIDLNISLLNLNAKNKNIKIINKVDPNLIAFIDNNTINTVIRNLLSNAIKFTRNGGKIVFESEYKLPYVYIKITDNGVGIPAEMINDLFRVDVVKSTLGTNQEKGTGLGLVICKEFVEKNNGSIKVESKLNEGTTFTLTLPAFNDNYPLPPEYIPEFIDDSNQLINKYSEEQFSVPVDTYVLNHLNEILKELEGDIYVKFLNADNTMVMSCIKLFINDLSALAKKFNFPFLIQYANELNKYSDNLEIDLITQKFNEFPKIIKYLKNLLD